ncbi:MAG: hypothetical protein ACRD4R_08645 [Candidatus Acidiferrales bacterium]
MKSAATFAAAAACIGDGTLDSSTMVYSGGCTTGVELLEAICDFARQHGWQDDFEAALQQQLHDWQLEQKFRSSLDSLLGKRWN